MPCSSEGYPPSYCYGDLIGTAQAAIDRIHELERELVKSDKDNKKLKQELHSLKEAFKIMGNGG